MKKNIYNGVISFLEKFKVVFDGKKLKEIYIFLAGNSSKSKFVEEIFENELTEEFKQKYNIILKDAYSIENETEGEVIGLIGESGSGKTIFTKYILGILPLAAQYTQETFEVVPKVGAIFQNAFTSLNPTMKIGKQLKHLYVSHYGTQENWKEKIESLLEDVGLDKNRNFLDKYPKLLYLLSFYPD